MALWKQLEQDEIKRRVFDGLQNIINYREETVLGLPGSHLDNKVFGHDVPFLKNAPFLSCMVQNPNHIGCHTMGESEAYFAGTQKLEEEVIRICGEEILDGAPGSLDGYVAAGGTEANIQAMWIYRNQFMTDAGALPSEIAVICSTDSHYSMPKGANLLNIPCIQVAPDPDNRTISQSGFRDAVRQAKADGIKHVIVVANLMTTMFGAVDDVDMLVEASTSAELDFRIHIDGAYGGFFYPFTDNPRPWNFSNPHISSITLDAHKMLQAPYGTGIFLCRKGLMEYVLTEEAQYVSGMDLTLSGSRSGANAVSIWMILMTYGPMGWRDKIQTLMQRTTRFCKALDELKIRYYRGECSNIVVFPKGEIPERLVSTYKLVPDTHSDDANWYKIVVMDHVGDDLLSAFIEELS